MNPEFVANNITHSIGDKLVEYLAKPFTNIFVVLILIIMFANSYMFRKLWKIKKRDYTIVLNMITLGIYFIFSVISAVLVSRLGPHGTLKADDCDIIYMTIPRVLFTIVSFANIIYFIVNMLTKMKKDKLYEETVKRGYYADEVKQTRKIVDENNDVTTKHIDLSKYVGNVKEKIDELEISDKISQITDNVKDFINKRNDKE